MTRFKVDDQFHSHPKVMATEPDALGLWVVAGSWCCAALTDGFVPDYVLPRLLPGAVKLARKLVTAGLWVEVEGGHQFHGWHEFNLSAEEEKRRKADAARRQKEWRERSSTKRNASRNASNNGAPSSPTPHSSSVWGGEGKSPNKPRLIHSWCGECDEESRMVERDDGRLARCPRCSRSAS